MKVQYVTLFGLHPPQVCAPTRQNLRFFSFAGKSRISAKFFQDHYVRDGCIYRATVLGREGHAPKVSFGTILSTKFFEKFCNFLQLNPQGKWTKPLFSVFWPNNRFEVHESSINRFLRKLDLNSQVFNNFYI